MQPGGERSLKDFLGFFRLGPLHFAPDRLTKKESAAAQKLAEIAKVAPEQFEAIRDGGKTVTAQLVRCLLRRSLSPRASETHRAGAVPRS